MSLRFAILGFLSIRPLSGYELKKAFDRSVRHFWSADQAQIYRELDALRRAGFARAQRVAGTVAAERKVHHITPVGRAVLDEWLASPAPRTQRREPFLVKLFFSGRLSRSQRQTLIASELADLEGDLDALVRGADELLARQTDAHVDVATLTGPAMTLMNGMTLGRAYRTWLIGLLEDNGNPRATRTTVFDDLRRASTSLRKRRRTPLLAEVPHR